MSNTDSFIDEVTEEVRRDRLFATFKRWAPIGLLAVLLLVGGAAYNEWRKASDTAEAERFGDALMAGIEADDQGETLAAVSTTSDRQAAITKHLAAADALSNDNRDLALRELQAVQGLADAPAIYTELAALKAAMAMSPATPSEERLSAFEPLSAPGAPFRPLAMEQIALIEIETGQTDAALERLSGLLEEAQATPGLQRRVSELIVALGGTPGGDS